jgi:tetratricopeptide (TPR) repeat protein
MGQPEGQGSAPEIAQRVADRTGVEMVLSGSFMKAGEELRIDVRLREAQSGKLIATSKVEGAGESSLFRMVDELGHRIRERLDVGPMGVHASRDLEEITTASIEAYRFYVEGVRLQRERKFQEAIPLFEKAVETDPDFAMALTRLSRLHGWFGRSSESEEYLNRALEHLDRLTLPERYYIEGYLHARKGIEGWSDEIETYEKLLEIDPDFSTARFQLALTYAFFGMTDKVVEHTDALRLRAYPDPQTYGMYARAHGTLGRFEPGYQAVQEYVRRTMDPSAVYWGYLTLGNHLTFWGRYSEAMEALETAEELRPELLEPQTSRWMIQVLREDWQGADVAADHVRASSDPGWKWQGWARKAINALYTGHSAESLELLTRAVGAHPRGKSTTDVLTAYVLLESGLAEPALKRAGAARTASGNLPEWEGLYYEALAQARLQQMEEAETTAEELRRQTELLPGPRWIRRYGHHLPGEIALARGDTSMAIQELTEAESLLTERGTGGAGRSFPWGISQHVPIWFALANAHLAAGDKDEAARWFERIADSTTEHVVWPIPYIRSFYFLGSIYEDRGNLARAHQYYQRFVDFWKGGDLDRQRIEEAEMKLASIEGSNTKLTQSRRP